MLNNKKIKKKGKIMTKTKWLLLIITLVITTGSAAEKYIANTKRLSSTEIAISCANGGDPTGTKIGNTLIISCGK